MVNITDPKDCCGCTACEAICPKDAITMQPDALGFKYPVVDTERCIDCDACVRVCAFNDHYDTSANLPQPVPYGVRHKDMRQIETSRSGAAFIAISDYILQQGGVVYGAGYADHFRVVHKRATTPGERDEFKGSKYVQSDLEGVFRQVKADLKAGLTVLFSGTPCQAAGLTSYVGKKLRENLYVVDIVCHGVPGPYLWRDFIAYLERKQGAPVCWVNFRDKQLFGWRAHRETFKFVNRGGATMWFTETFYNHIMFRHSCGDCHFANLKRPGDITIADFWGWEKTDPTFNADDKGCNLVLVNTEKGRRLFEAVRGELNVIDTTLDLCMQPNLSHPSVIHPRRMDFERDYSRHGLEYVMRKYGISGIRRKLAAVKGKVRSLLHKIINVICHE